MARVGAFWVSVYRPMAFPPFLGLPRGFSAALSGCCGPLRRPIGMPCPKSATAPGCRFAQVVLAASRSLERVQAQRRIIDHGRSAREGRSGDGGYGHGQRMRLCAVRGA